MSQQFILALDTETGGLDHDTADVLTIYMAMVDESFKIVDELDLKLKPDGRLPVAEAGALRVNRIDLQKHVNDPETLTYSQAREKMIEFFRKYLRKNGRYSNITPLGQNVDFDLGFIWKHLMPKKEWNSWIHYGKIDTKQIVDFLKHSKWFPKELGSLGSVVEYLGLPMRQAHGAREDTLMTLDVYKRILEIMDSKKEGGQTQDLIALLEAE